MAKKFQLDSDWYNYEREQLAKVAKRLFENANRRIRNIRGRGLTSPAYASVMETGGEFYVKGASTEELVKEIARCLTFLNSDDGSTVAQAKKYTRAIQQATPDLTPNESKKVWEIYRRLREEYPTFFASPKSSRGRYDSDSIVNEIRDKVIESRKRVIGGLGGDLPNFAGFSSAFKSSAAAQENEIMNIIKAFRAKIEDTVNSIIETYDGKRLDFGFLKIHVDVD